MKRSKRVLIIGDGIERFTLAMLASARVAASQMSQEDVRRLLDKAVADKFGTVGDSNDRWQYYVLETFDDYIVARGTDDKLFQIAYSIDVDGNVQLGEPKEVEEVYVPVAQAATFSATETGDDPLVYPVVVMKAGFVQFNVQVDRNKSVPMYAGEPVIAEVAAAVTGARFGRRHPLPGENEAAQPELVAGWFTDGKVVGDEAHATLHLLESETDLQQKLAAAKKANKLNLFGLSVLAYFSYKLGTVDGKECAIVTKLAKLARVDWCAEPAAGGRFLQVAASADLRAEIADLQTKARKSSPAISGEDGSAAGAGSRQKGAAMKDSILKLLAALRKHDAGKAEQLTTEFNSLAEDKHTEFFTKVTAAVSDSIGSATAAGEASTTLATAQEVLKKAELIQSTNLVNAKLADSKLPAPAIALARTHLKDRVVTEAEVDAEIAAVRTAFAAFDGTGRTTVRSGAGVIVDSQDKIEAGLDAMFGVKFANSGSKVAEAEYRRMAFTSLPQAYKAITGDDGLQFGVGGMGGFTKVSAAVATGDFPNLLLNSMTKRLLQDYAEEAMDGLDQVFDVVPLSDFKANDRVRWGYLADLAIVAEAGPYVEIVKPTDEKVSYSPQKRGGIVTISRETILNDDLGALKAYPTRIARAGRRTLRRFITNFFVNNPNYGGDGVAWFHATHNNLGAAELSVDELILREVALGTQTEKDSGERIGFDLNWLMVPVNRYAQACKINQAQTYNPGPDIIEPNPFYQRFGANNERIIKNILLVDVNDWFYGASKTQGPILEIGFVGGVQEPQLFINNDPSNGSVPFTNDQVQYKVRHEYGGVIVDFRPVGKNVV